MTRRIAANELDPTGLAEIGKTLVSGGVVCFPTDTVYALGVNPSSAEAVERLFELKGRDPSKPILLIVDSLEMARALSVPNPLFEEVTSAFWPGPITLVTGAGEHVSDRLTSGTGTIGLRCPEASLPCRIVQALGGAITGTSANRSGEPVATSADEASVQLGHAVDIVIDGGPLKARPPSTILDVSSEPPVLIREGPVTYDQLVRFFDGHLQRRTA